MSEVIPFLGQIWGQGAEVMYNNRALNYQQKANQQSTKLAYQEREDQLRREREEQLRLDAAWAAEQNRLAPYRNTSMDVMRSHGYDVPDWAYQGYERPPNWQPGQPVKPNTNYYPTDYSGFSNVSRRTPTASRWRDLLGRG